MWLWEVLLVGWRDGLGGGVLKEIKFQNGVMGFLFEEFIEREDFVEFEAFHEFDSLDISLQEGQFGFNVFCENDEGVGDIEFCLGVFIAD